MSPRRTQRDVASVNRVLELLALLLAGLAVAILGYGVWEVLAQTRLPSSGEPVEHAVRYAAVAVTFAAVGLGCWRLSRDDGTGTWCEECLARNPLNAPLCASCGSELPSRRQW